MRAVAIGILSLAMALSGACAAEAAGKAEAEWPGWRGANRDGKSPDIGLLKQWPKGGPRLLWKAGNLGNGYSSVAVSGGRVYTTGETDGKLYVIALDLAGKPRWKTEVDAAFTGDHPGARATPAIDGGRLYLLSGNGTLVCLDAAQGSKLWSRSAKEFGGRPGGWGYAESVLIDGNRAVFKPGGAKCIAALDKETGQDVWTSTGFTAGPEYSSCLAVDFLEKQLIVTGTSAGLVCVDAETGKLLWINDHSANNTANCPTPAYADGHVFWANGYGKGGICMKLLRKGDTVNAEVAWTTKDMVCQHGAYVIHKGFIYGNHEDGWSCLELKTGKPMWKQRGVGKGSLCYADGMLYLFSEREGRGALASCSPQGLEGRGAVQVQGNGPSWAHPVVIGGRMYLRYDTTLYCFKVAAR